MLLFIFVIAGIAHLASSLCVKPSDEELLLFQGPQYYKGENCDHLREFAPSYADNESN